MMTINSWHKHARSIKRTVLLLMLFILPPALPVNAQQPPAPSADQNAAPDTAVLANMNNRRNPLIQITTNVGDIWIELFPQAAPANVEHLLTLIGNEEWRQRLYENNTFHRIERNLVIQTGAQHEQPTTQRQQPPAVPYVSDEINALGLGLEQLPALQADGQPHPWLNISDADDFRTRLLRPLYDQLGINTVEELADRQNEVLSTLAGMNLLQVHEMLGYEYNTRLPSRRPLSGSVVMVNRGPGSNQSEFAILLADMPWLTGTHTVIGQMVGGETPATLISQRRPGNIFISSIGLATPGQPVGVGSEISQAARGLQ